MELRAPRSRSTRPAMLLGLDSSKKQGIFGTYVMLWVSSHVLVYASKMPGAPQYNATSVVLITEAVKLVMALAFYRRYDGDSSQLVREVRDGSAALPPPTPRHLRALATLPFRRKPFRWKGGRL